MTREEKIKELLYRGVDAVYPSTKILRDTLLGGRKKLRIYLGADPTGPDLHIGHATNLLLLKRFQELGHKIIFLIGDFTAQIGDPTGKVSTRRALAPEEVKFNERKFKQQASRVISFSGRNAAEIRHNSEWYKRMTLDKFIANVVSFFTVMNVLNRDMFKERRRGRSEEGWLDGISFKELIYPLLQGYDGEAMKVDVEVGGNDQTFNMSIGRALRKAFDKKNEKFFIATTLLVHPVTQKKLMNKSEGGAINIGDKPEDMFGKVMARDDATMLPIAEFCTEMPMDEVHALKKDLLEKTISPRDAKYRVARAVVATFYDRDDALRAEEHFTKLFSKKEMPKKLPALTLTKKTLSALELVMASGIVTSRGQARRLIEQGGLSVGHETKTNPQEMLVMKGGDPVKIGKKRFFRVQ